MNALHRLFRALTQCRQVVANELEVALAQLTSKKIAMNLGLSPRTVETHRGRIIISALIDMMILGVGVAVIGSVVAVQLSEMFSTDMRYTASGMCYNFSFALFGGTAPYVATWMTANTANMLSPAIYVTAVALFVTAWVFFFIPETANKPLRRFHTEPQYDKEKFDVLTISSTKLDVSA